MVIAFLIMLREGLEAALLIGIMAGYTARRGKSRALPSLWAGAVAALLAAGAGGWLLQWTGQEFPERAQDIFESLVALVAITLLISMVLWMRQAAPRLKRELEAQVDRSLADDMTRWVPALFLTAFLIVGREAPESSMFLIAILQQSSGKSAATGALAGLFIAVAVGFAIFRLGLRLDLRRFFRVTGGFVILVAAGLAASVLRSLHEAGVWNGLQGTAFDLSGALPTDGVAGTLLSGIFGYSATPTWGEVVVYLIVLIGTGWLFLRPLPRPMTRHGAAPGA